MDDQLVAVGHAHGAGSFAHQQHRDATRADELGQRVRQACGRVEWFPTVDQACSSAIGGLQEYRAGQNG